MATTTYLQLRKAIDREDSLESFLNSRLDELDASLGNHATIVSLASASGNVDLSPTEARSPIIKLTGNPTAAVTLKIPHATGARAKIHFINTCGGSFPTVTIKSMGANTTNAAGVSLATGRERTIRHDGNSAFPAELEVDTATGLTTAAQLGVVICHISHNANQSIGTGPWTALAMNTDVYDPLALHDVVTNNSRITFNFTGRVECHLHFVYDSNSTGVRSCSIRKNGTSFRGVVPRNATSGDNTGAQALCELDVVPGDYVEPMALQNSGVSLNVLSAADYSPHFFVKRVG